MSTTITVELCGGNRKGINKTDIDDTSTTEDGVIEIKLMPESHADWQVLIEVMLLPIEWEAIEAEETQPTLAWSQVDMFYEDNNTVVTVIDGGDNLYYGYTKIEGPKPKSCDWVSTMITGSHSGDFHQWLPKVVNDGLIGSSTSDTNSVWYASLVPGELIWFNYFFRKTYGYSSITAGYRAPHITGGRIIDKKWNIINLVYIYKVDYEGLTGWFFNASCIELNIGQWVFLNTEISEDFTNTGSLEYGSALDNAKCFILPIRINGYGPESDFWYNVSKYYSNIRFIEGDILYIDRNIHQANVDLPSLGLVAQRVKFYCPGDGIDAYSGIQFLKGDKVLLMVKGPIGVFTDNMKIIGILPFTIMPLGLGFISDSMFFNKDNVYDYGGRSIYNDKRQLILPATRNKYDYSNTPSVEINGVRKPLTVSTFTTYANDNLSGTMKISINVDGNEVYNYDIVHQMCVRPAAYESHYTQGTTSSTYAKIDEGIYNSGLGSYGLNSYAGGGYNWSGTKFVFLVRILQRESILISENTLTLSQFEDNCGGVYAPVAMHSSHSGTVSVFTERTYITKIYEVDLVNYGVHLLFEKIATSTTTIETNLNIEEQKQYQPGGWCNSVIGLSRELNSESHSTTVLSGSIYTGVSFNVDDICTSHLTCEGTTTSSVNATGGWTYPDDEHHYEVTYGTPTDYYGGYSAKQNAGTITHYPMMGGSYSHGITHYTRYGYSNHASNWATFNTYSVLDAYYDELFLYHTTNLTSPQPYYCKTGLLQDTNTYNQLVYIDGLSVYDIGNYTGIALYNHLDDGYMYSMGPEKINVYGKIYEGLDYRYIFRVFPVYDVAYMR